jgi:hypothetical protein
MKLLNNLWEAVRQAIQEMDRASRDSGEEFFWGVSDRFERGDDPPRTNFNRFVIIAFAVALVIWVIACLAAGNAGYISAN